MEVHADGDSCWQSPYWQKPVLMGGFAPMQARVVKNALKWVARRRNLTLAVKTTLKWVNHWAIQVRFAAEMNRN